MATLAEGEARTIVVAPSGPPSSTLTAILPPGVTISLESVLAAIDASGAGDTTALLEIADSSGAVIARKAQGQVVTGGSVGSATWALRLGDETPAAPVAAGGIEFTAHGVYGPVNTGDALDVETTVGDQTFNAHVHNVVVEGGQNGAGRQGRVTVSPTVQILGGDATNFGVNQAELDVGTIASPAIEAWARAYTLHLGSGNTGAAAGDFVVKAHGGGNVLLVRDAGGQNQLGVFGIGPVARQAVAGAKGGNVALANLLTALANYGFIIDNTTP